MHPKNTPPTPVQQRANSGQKRKARPNLSDAFCRTAKPGRWSDDTGERGVGRLNLHVSESGKRTWHFRVQTSTTNTIKLIGRYPEMSLTQAREAARALSGREDSLAKTGSFDDLLQTYVKHLRDRGAASTDSVESELKLSIPLDSPIRKKAARDVTTADIAAILQAKRAKKIKRNGEEVQIGARVNRLRSILAAAFSYVAKNDYHPDRPKGSARFLIQSNPVLGTPHVAAWEQLRHRTPTQSEMRAFFDLMAREQARLEAELARMRVKLGDDVASPYLDQPFHKLQNNIHAFRIRAIKLHAQWLGLDELAHPEKAFAGQLQHFQIIGSFRQ